MDFNKLTKLAVQAAWNAGKIIQTYKGQEIEVLKKQGGDTLASQVVTEVDHKAQAAILNVLKPSSLKLDIAILTEESEDDQSRFEKDFFWCIDPMDGTLAFTRGEPGYSVSIGLVAKDGTPLVGVVYDPVKKVLYQATKGSGVRRNGETWSLKPSSKRLTFTYDRSLTKHPNYSKILQDLEAYAQSQRLDEMEATQHGGSVLNACHALEKAPGCHFKFPKPEDGGGSLWDYAATACLFEEAGAVVSDVYGAKLDLNRADSTFMNHRGVIYATDSDLARKVEKIISG